MTDVNATAKKIIANVEKVIVGKRQQLILRSGRLVLRGAHPAGGRAGRGQDDAGPALASSVGCTFKRIQCTPDLLPTDVTGRSIFNQKTAEFEFRPGPIFAQLVLADEINRTTPRTQAALLEAMAEGRVTVDGMTHELTPPFLVIATQNPIDHEGTFPLPEAQLDRFLMRFSLGYPTMDEELQMLEMLQHEHPLDRPEAGRHGRRTGGLPAGGAGDSRRREGATVPDADRARHARARRLESGRQPAGQHRPVPHVPGAGGVAGTQVRAARRRQTSRRTRLDPSRDPEAGEPPAESDRRARGRGSGGGDRGAHDVVLSGVR